MKAYKKITSLLMVICMLLGNTIGALAGTTITLEPTHVSSEDTGITVSTRIEADVTTISPKNNFDIKKFDLRDYGLSVNPAYPTAMHALISTLESADVYEYSDITSDGYVMSICYVGDSNIAWMYMVNGIIPDGIPMIDYALQEGDNVVFFCVDWQYGYITQFDKEEASVVIGENLSLTLMGDIAYSIAYGNPSSPEPIKGAELLVSDVNTVSADDGTSILTGEDGKAEISFDEVGEYLISAVRYKSNSIDISRPYCKVTVTELPSSIPVADISVNAKDNATAITLKGGQLQMLAMVMPATATDTSVTWSIATGGEYATIDSTTGVLSAKGNGAATIRATANDASGIYGEFVVNISGQEASLIPVSDITVKGKEGATTITANGGQLQMLATASPEDATDRSVKWSITNGKGYATIDSETGLLTATGNGAATVRATAKDGSNEFGEIVINISGQVGNILTSINSTIDSISNRYSGVSDDEWKIIELAALDKQINKVGFLAFLQNNLKSGGSYYKNVKDLEKAAIALSSLGMDACYFPLSNGESVNLITAIANYKNNTDEYNLLDISGEAFALSAYDSGDYPDAGHFTREALINKLVTAQEDDGSWKQAGISNVDMSAMAVTSLSPYYSSNEKVKTAIDKYVAWISSCQQKDGTYANGSNSNSNSTSFAIISLSSIGIDAHTDSRFIKNGNSAIDGLLSFKTTDNMFKYLSIGSENALATEQAFRALICYAKSISQGFGYNIYKFGKVDPIEINNPTAEDKDIEITDKPLYIIVPQDVDAAIITPDTNILPELSIIKQTTGTGITMNVAQGTIVTADGDWDGKIQLPQTVTLTISGIDISTAVKVGADVALSFDKPIRLSIPDSKGKRVGYKDQSGNFTEITNILSADNAAALGDNRDGKITIDNDVVIWTKHFTTFVIYSASGGNPGEEIPEKTVSISVVGDSKKGTILSTTSVAVKDSASVFDILKKVLDSKGIPFEDVGESYISAIAGLYQFDNGPNSGWKYYVNGAEANIGVGAYIPKNRDRIEFKYVNDYTTGGDAGSDITASAIVSELDISKILENISKKDVLSNWEIFVLSRNGIKVSDKHFETFENELKEKNGVLRLATDYAKIALLLKVSDKSVKDFAGYNILEKIYDNNDIGKQGVNGYIFSLIVLNGEKDLPSTAIWNTDKLIKKILEYQNADGGFMLSIGGKSDIDITAMALCSLAPYKDVENVKSIIEKAVNFLKTSQNQDGSFATGSQKTSESISQVIIALSTLGINPKSADFTKKGNTLIDLLSTYKLKDETFAHIAGGASDEIATEQAILAITAYNFHSKGKGGIYHFDAKDEKQEEIKKETVNTEQKYIPKFTDISEYSWAEKEINYLAEKGVVTGVSETSFAPSKKITRADYICLLVRMLHLTTDIESNFSDVASDKYYYNEVRIAKNLGLISGIGDNRFAPEESITRQDMFTIAYSIMKMLKVDFVKADEDTIISFNDYEKITEYSVEPLCVFVKNGIISGWDNNLNPTSDSTRAECAVFIYGLDKIMNNQN